MQWKSEQQIFDIVWNHFVTNEGLPSLDEAEGCAMLRGPEGQRCAIGLLIPDEDYDLSMEFRSIRALLKYFPQITRLFQSIKIRFLEDLMDCHDDIVLNFWDGPSSTGAEFSNRIKYNLVQLALDYNLKIPEEA